VKKKIEELRLIEECTPDKRRSNFLDNARLAFRLGSKLREFELTLNKFAYVNVLLDPEKESGAAFNIEPSVTSSQVLNVRAPYLFLENEQEWTNYLSKIMAFVCTVFDGDAALVDRARQVLLSNGPETKIFELHKSTKNFEVDIYFKCKPSSNHEIIHIYTVHVFLHVLEKSMQHVVDRPLFETDIFKLRAHFGRLSVKGDLLEIHPKKSALADMYLRDVNLPKNISLRN